MCSVYQLYQFSDIIHWTGWFRALSGRQAGQDRICFQLVHSSLFRPFPPHRIGAFDGGDIQFSGGSFGTDWNLGLFEKDLPAFVASTLPSQA